MSKRHEVMIPRLPKLVRRAEPGSGRPGQAFERDTGTQEVLRTGC